MITKQVTVSGSVGKQVFTVGQGVDPTRLKGYSIYAPVSAATVVIRSGNASGDVIHEGQCALDEPAEFLFSGCIRFDHGMHVKVTGVGSAAYLYID